VSIDCYTDIDRYKQQLLDNFPKGKDGIHRYFKTSQSIWNELVASHYKPSFLQLLSYPLRFPHLVKYQNATYETFLDQFIKDGKLKELLGSGWGYLDSIIGAFPLSISSVCICHITPEVHGIQKAVIRQCQMHLPNVFGNTAAV
jgi:hypothetical protein